MNWIIFLLLFLAACSRRGDVVTRLEDVTVSIVRILQIPSVLFLATVFAFGVITSVVVRYGLEKSLGDTNLSNKLSLIAGALMGIFMFFNTRGMDPAGALAGFFDSGFGLFLAFFVLLFVAYTMKKTIDSTLFGGSP